MKRKQELITVERLHKREQKLRDEIEEVRKELIGIVLMNAMATVDNADKIAELADRLREQKAERDWIKELWKIVF